MKMAVVPDTNLTHRNSFLITSFTIAQKLRQDGLSPSFHAMEVYACGCSLDTTLEARNFQPCSVHEFPS